MRSGGQKESETQPGLAPAQLAVRQQAREAQEFPADGEISRAAHDALLLTLADALDDFERVRMASMSRVRALVEIKGVAGPEADRLSDMALRAYGIEREAEAELRRAMRAHPLGGWVRRTVGVGEKQAARLLAAVGDPAARPNPARFLQYCGHGDPVRSQARRGQPVEFNPIAKMRVHLIAKSCMTHRHSPYRAVYDRERAKWAMRDVSDGHRHNHALRVVGKEILKDLWREARTLQSAAS